MKELIRAWLIKRLAGECQVIINATLHLSQPLSTRRVRIHSNIRVANIYGATFAKKVLK